MSLNRIVILLRSVVIATWATGAEGGTAIGGAVVYGQIPASTCAASPERALFLTSPHFGRPRVLRWTPPHPVRHVVESRLSQICC